MTTFSWVLEATMTIPMKENSCRSSMTQRQDDLLVTDCKEASRNSCICLSSSIFVLYGWLRYVFLGFRIWSKGSIRRIIHHLYRCVFDNRVSRSSSGTRKACKHRFHRSQIEPTKKCAGINKSVYSLEYSHCTRSNHYRL